MGFFRRELCRLLFCNRKAEIQAIDADVLVKTYLGGKVGDEREWGLRS